MAKKKILVIEDELDIIKIIEFNLTQEGYNIISINSGKEAISTVQKEEPDLIILDIMIPDLDGFEICKLLKANDNLKHIPIIMLSAKSQEHSIVTGLELGADDYITKPFSVHILVARIRAVLRRKKPNVTEEGIETITIHDFKLNIKQHKLNVKGKNIEINHTEFKILYCLMQKPRLGIY